MREQMQKEKRIIGNLMGHLPLGLVIGSEGKGMGRSLEKNVIFSFSLPMAGHVTSLNASVAAALLMYEVYRKRHPLRGIKMDILLVDGYNIIGAWPELREMKNNDLAAARDRLVEKMAEYQGIQWISSNHCFDAYDVQGIRKKI